MTNYYFFKINEDTECHEFIFHASTEENSCDMVVMGSKAGLLCSPCSKAWQLYFVLKNFTHALLVKRLAHLLSNLSESSCNFQYFLINDLFLS